MINDLKTPNLDTIIDLYIVDATNLGADDVARFCSSTISNSAIIFNNKPYFPIPIDVKGFERSAAGELARPVVKVGNVAQTISGLVILYNDLVGAKFTRIRTFKKYLDNFSTADPTKIFAEEIYIIQQKKSQNKLFIEFQLTSILDQEGEKLPGRICVSEYCSLVYRKYDTKTNNFIYSRHSPCPYQGTTYYTKSAEETTDPALDVCGKKMKDCEARFKQNVLPGTFFPGLRRIR